MQLDQIQLKKNYPNMHHQELTHHLTKLTRMDIRILTQTNHTPSLTKLSHIIL